MKRIHGDGNETSITATHDNGESSHALAFSEYRTIKAMELVEDGMAGETAPNREASDWNSKNYLGASGTCPYCKVAMKVVQRRPGSFEKNAVWECQLCGWWELERVFSAGGVEHEVAYSAIHHQACLKRFNINSASAPTGALVDHLRKKPEAVFGINKRKMEEVVQYIFSSFYNCEVHHCGKSHDGGVDLIMIDSDFPTLIQVKCRESMGVVEPISQIRDFLGAMWISKSNSGIFVSTADHYSPVSVKTIQTMLADGSLTFFDMVDFGRLAELFKATPSPKETIWKKLFDEFYIEGETG